MFITPEFVSDRPDSESYDKFRFKLQEMGFEAGWGNTARACFLASLYAKSSVLNGCIHGSRGLK
ncbi:MAG: hypothetical protein F6K65_17315 [Moorea sp. SIO3C2]|nr:hypothetical protein [Moorena sp. SIO3C2]